MSTAQCLLYNPRVPVNLLTPLINIDQLIMLCNYTINKKDYDLDPGADTELARIVRVNFIYNDLKKNRLKIIKPLFLEASAFGLITVQGDTRLMAAELCGITQVSCLAQIPVFVQGLFKDWVQVENVKHLSQLTNFDITEIQIRYQENKNIDQIEFSSATTAHHMHDFDQRLRMIKNYIKQQPKTFEFSREWCRLPINWAEFEVDKV